MTAKLDQTEMKKLCQDLENKCKHFLNQWAILTGSEMAMRKVVADSISKWMADGAKVCKPPGSEFLPDDMPALTEAVRNLGAACFVARWFSDLLQEYQNHVDESTASVGENVTNN